MSSQSLEELPQFLKDLGFGSTTTTTVKKPRLSTHLKYKRRLHRLSRVLADFVSHAEDKLANRTYKRTEIERIVATSRELAKLLPDPHDLQGPQVREDFLDWLGSDEAQKSTDAIMAAAKDGAAEYLALIGRRASKASSPPKRRAQRKKSKRRR